MDVADEQRHVGQEDVSGLQFQAPPLTSCNYTIFCGISTTSQRPFVLPSHCNKLFPSLHNLPHRES
ncbi:unnamed protein product [Schistocephalus solidus]|uniref:Ovule protein n=1 Tax=Schistocephalus solidus TaxID=70667 RepID=A0A183SZX1_SCHSO|nr:unnamed protein product [Schistocephalus solidus]